VNGFGCLHKHICAMKNFMVKCCVCIVVSKLKNTNLYVRYTLHSHRYYYFISSCLESRVHILHT
jgi:hypothetical protein